MNARNLGVILAPQKKRVRLLSTAITLLLAFAWSLVMPTTRLFAAESGAEELACVSSNSTASQFHNQLHNNGEPACEAAQLANGDTESDTGSETVIGSPDAPIILDDTHMPRLVMQLYLPLASR